MSNTINISADPAKVARAFAGTELVNLRPLWPTVRGVIAADIKRTIETQGSNTGNTWPELSPYTLARRQRLGFGRSALYLTGYLLATMGNPSKGRVAESKTTLKFGTSEKTFYVQHYGSKRIPARPFVALSGNAKGEIDSLIDAHLDRLIDNLNKRLAVLGAR